MLPSIDQMHQCAPNVSHVTMTAIINVESGGNAFALGVNGPIRNRPHPQNAQQAAVLARYYIGLGYSVDLGLMQINSSNLRGLGLSIEQVLEPCNNLRAGSRILSRGYAGASKHFGEGQAALKAALSAYNTGNYERGFKNGYVAKYYRGAGIRVVVTSPALVASAKKIETTQPSKVLLNPYLADTTVYKRPDNLAKESINQKELSYGKEL
jgi:type IV secretion system protein VirB1